MDELVEYINSLKKEFDNVSFINVSQMNRDIEGRIDVRHLAPKRSDLYNTDTLFQISDLVLVIHNPYKLGHEKYMVVAPMRYHYLIQHMDKPNNKRTNFTTKNLIFWHYLKIREIEDMENIADIHVENLKVPNLQDKLKTTEREKIIVSDADLTETERLYKEVVQPEIHNSLPDDFLNDNDGRWSSVLKPNIMIGEGIERGIKILVRVVLIGIVSLIVGAFLLGKYL